MRTTMVPESGTTARRRREWLGGLSALVALVALVGCGGGGGGGNDDDGTPTPAPTATPTATPTPVPTATPGFAAGVEVSPNAASLGPGALQLFRANVLGTGNNAVTWSVQEGDAGGSITSDGIYTAPGRAGVYHVVAVSQQDPSKSAVVTVTVSPQVRITPNNTLLNVGDTLGLQAQVVGLDDQSVTWSVTEASGGTVSADGVYRAPATPGTYHVVATSVADPAQTATATFTIQAGNLTGVIQ